MSKAKIVADMEQRMPVVMTGLTPIRDEALEIIDIWFDTLQVLIGEDSELTSELSGEVITGDEFWRARGIISALRMNERFVLTK